MNTSRKTPPTTVRNPRTWIFDVTISIPLRELTYGPCPYLSAAPSWKVAEFSCRELAPGAYEGLLGRGFRRSGTTFYRTACEDCDLCIPIRIDADRFEPTRSQRRVLRMNAETIHSCDSRGVGFREDRYRLYEAYSRDRHGRSPDAEEGALAYLAFLVDSPLGPVAVTEYSVPSVNGLELVGNGYLDVLPDGLSSIYFVWTEIRQQAFAGNLFNTPGDRALPLPGQEMVLPRVLGARLSRHGLQGQFRPRRDSPRRQLASSGPGSPGFSPGGRVKTRKNPASAPSGESELPARARIDELNERAWTEMFDDFEIALDLARTALGESEKLGYTEGIAYSLLNIGWCKDYLGMNEEARVAFERALELYRILDDAVGRSKALNGLGVLCYHMSRYERALDYYTQSLDEARRHGLRSRETTTLNNIGEVCAELGNYKEALDYFLKAYDIVPEEKGSELRATILLNIGKSFVRLENYVLAEEFVRKALELAEPDNERIVIASSWDILGRIARGLGNLNVAEERFRKAIALAEGIKSRREIIEAMLDLGSLLIDRGQLAEAQGVLEKAAKTSEDIHAKALYFSAYERLAETHEKLGDHRLALDYFRRYVRYEREILNEDTTRKIKDVQIQYEVERTQREAEIYRLRNIELKEKTESLEEMNRQILTISEIGQRITSSLDMETMVATLYDSLHALMVTDLFAIALHDSMTDILNYTAYIQDGKRISRDPVQPDPKRSFASWCIRHDTPVCIRDLYTEYRNYLEGEPKVFLGKPAHSFIYLPLSIEKKVIGVLTVQGYAKNAYTDHHLRFLTALAPYVAIAVENSLIHVRVEELNRELKGEKEQLERATHQISYLANHDSLTGLPNRRLLFELLRTSFEMARRSGSKVGILYVDLDDFKPINDRFGHLAGDRALVEISERLQSVLRASDTVARVGGDEFIAVLNHVRNKTDVDSAARKVMEVCDSPLDFLGEDCRIGASMGIAIFPDDGDSLEALVHCADSAMYSIKHTSKKGYAFYKKYG